MEEAPEGTLLLLLLPFPSLKIDPWTWPGARSDQNLESNPAAAARSPLEARTQTNGVEHANWVMADAPRMEGLVISSTPTEVLLCSLARRPPETSDGI